MFFGQKNEKTVLPTRDINLILGYYDHNDMMPALAQPYLGKPEMSVEPLSDTEYAIKCKTQAAPLMLEVWGIEGQKGIYHGSMKGTEDDDFDPPEYWRDYKRLDPETFQVKFRTPKGAKHPIFYFINYNYLGASWYGDEQVYASAA